MEAMYEGAQGHAIAQGGGEVSDLDAVVLHLLLQPLLEHHRVAEGVLV